MGGAILLALVLGAPERSSAQPTCDELADYSYFDLNYGLTNFEYHVTQDEIWDVDMNVHGTIVVDAGKTLVIDGATIQFGDSRHMAYRTVVIVSPTAHLLLKSGAVLTCLEYCTGSMWDGIMVLGDPSASEASGEQGMLTMIDATIKNAVTGVFTGYCFEPLAWPSDPVVSTGGIVICEHARFIDNIWSVVLRPYNHPDNAGETQTHFFRCEFLTLNPVQWCEAVPPPCDMGPSIMLYAAEVGHLRIGGCTFSNSYGFPNYIDAGQWGDGILAYNTSVSILPLCDDVYTGAVPCLSPAVRTPCVFRGLFRAVQVLHWSPDRFAEVVRASFLECIRSVNLQGVMHSTVVQNDVAVPLDPANVLNPRGLGFSNCTAFEVQENEIGGPPNNDFTQPNTGMWFSNSGDAPNMFYNNRFFGPLTVGTIIQGDNDGPFPGDGLQFKCNNYGYNDLPNQFDMAFTGNQVSVGDKQGTGFDPTTPAGNTFSPTCENGETHMWVQNGAINTFAYWYHDPISTTELVYPACRTNPPLINNWYSNSFFSYQALGVCDSQTDLFTDGGGGVVVLEAEENHNLLKQVYDEQRDGGDTEGLKDYIADPAHSSYDVRNQLMLVAPDVSSGNWSQVFARDPAMNSWHLAQALLANVPLQPEVITLMENSGLDPYYQQLVRGAQGSGISQLTIMESEMGHWMNRRERALNAMAMEALKTGGATVLHDALDLDEDHPQTGLPLNRLGLLMAAGDLSGAKDIVDDLLLAAEPDAGMEVLGMYLDLKITGLDIHDVSTSDRGRLQAIANTYGPGQGQAQGWLECIGEGPFDDEMILPNEERAMQWADPKAHAPIELLAAYPNPSDSKQPVYVVVHLPEGMQQAGLLIVDPLGRIVRDEMINRNAAIIELPPTELTNGLYVASLSVGELQLGTVKFTVAH